MNAVLYSVCCICPLSSGSKSTFSETSRRMTVFYLKIFHGCPLHVCILTSGCKFQSHLVFLRHSHHASNSISIPWSLRPLQHNLHHWNYLEHVVSCTPLSTAGENWMQMMTLFTIWPEQLAYAASMQRLFKRISVHAWIFILLICRSENNFLQKQRKNQCKTQWLLGTGQNCAWWRRCAHPIRFRENPARAINQAHGTTHSLLLCEFPLPEWISTSYPRGNIRFSYFATIPDNTKIFCSYGSYP